MTVLFDAWPPVPPTSTETSAKPSFSSTTASRTVRIGVSTIVSLSTMLIRPLALRDRAVDLRAEVEREGLEGLGVLWAVEELHPNDLRRLSRREVECAEGADGGLDVVVGAAVGGNRGAVGGRVTDRNGFCLGGGQAHHQIDEAVPLPDNRVGRREYARLRAGGGVARSDRDGAAAIGDGGVEGVAQVEEETLLPLRVDVIRDRDDNGLRGLPGGEGERSADRGVVASRARRPVRGRIVDGDGGVRGLAAGPPSKTETRALPSFSSTTASRTNNFGVGTIVSLSTMLILTARPRDHAVLLRGQVEGEGLERLAVEVVTVEDLRPERPWSVSPGAKFSVPGPPTEGMQTVSGANGAGSPCCRTSSSRPRTGSRLGADSVTGRSMNRPPHRRSDRRARECPGRVGCRRVARRRS